MSAIPELKKSIENFYQQNMSWTAIENDTTRIDTPFLDRHNDALIIYATQQPDLHFKLTDGGYVLDDLESDGIYITRSQRRLQLLKEQLTNFSIKLDTDTHELFIMTSVQDYAVNQNLLLQAMLFVNDMFLLSNKKITSIFINEVANFFELNNIRVTVNPNIIGPSGMIHHYDFSIPGIRQIPEKLIKTMNTSNNEYYAKTIALDKRQTQIVRPQTIFYTFINDTETISDNILSLFSNENIIVIPFSQRDKYLEQLAK